MPGLGAIGSIPIGGFQGVTAAPAAVVSPQIQGLGECFVSFPDGTIDVTMHKIETGISA